MWFDCKYTLHLQHVARPDPVEGYFQRGIRRDVRFDGIIAETLPGTGHVAGGGDQELIAIGQFLDDIGAGVACRRRPEGLHRLQAAETQERGLAGAGGPIIRKNGDGGR